MKILLGKILHAYEDEKPAIWIDGLGGIGANLDENDNPYIELNKEHMIMLRDLLIKELSNEETNI